MPSPHQRRLQGQNQPKIQRRSLGCWRLVTVELQTTQVNDQGWKQPLAFTGLANDSQCFFMIFPEYS